MKYRVGRWTTGISLVLMGIVILLTQFTDQDLWSEIGSFWPLILIGYGIEYLLAARKEEKLSFDLLGASIIAITLVVTSAFGVIGSFGFDFGFVGSSYTFEDEPIVIDEAELNGITSFFADTSNGRIRVEPATDHQITILATYKMRGSSEEQALQRKEEIELKVDHSGDRVSAKVMYPRKWFLGWTRGAVDLSISLPSNLLVDADTSNGEIRIINMDNVGEVSTSNGAIYVTDSKGRAELDTSNGRIEVENFSGALHAETSNGRIVASGEVNGDWKLETSNGSIEVTLPEGGSYDYDFDTSNGRIEAPNPPFEGRESKTRYRGEINGGRNKLDISTSNGDIDIMVR